MGFAKDSHLYKDFAIIYQDFVAILDLDLDLDLDWIWIWIWILDLDLAGFGLILIGFGSIWFGSWSLIALIALTAPSK